MRPTELEDPRILLEEHLLEQAEVEARGQVIDMYCEVLASVDPEERDAYRWMLGEARRWERKMQRANGTLLVLDLPTYDREAGDEVAEVTRGDLQFLSSIAVVVPETACLIDEGQVVVGWDGEHPVQARIGPVPADADRWGGWAPTLEQLREEPMIGESAIFGPEDDGG